jgi:peptidyl-prolyl cis-trans isomerase D
MAKEPRQRIVTKKHLARIERERRQQRYIMTGALIVLLLVVGFITYGILENYILKPYQPVATVGNERITTKEFQNRARYLRQGYVSRYNETIQIAQMFGDDPSTQQYIQSNLAQIQAQLEPSTLGQQVLDMLVEESLIRQEAGRLGISVSQGEIDKALQEAFGYFADGTPTPAPTEAVRSTSTLSPTQLALVPPTPTIAPTEVPTVTETVEATEVAPVEEPTATPDPNATATPTAAPLPTATAYTFEAFQTQYSSVMESYTSNINFTEADFRDLFEAQLLRDKVMEAVVGDLPREDEYIWARHILVPDGDFAYVLYTRLIEGEDFATLAEENSTDGSASQGGDLGWFIYEDMVPEFSEAAFSLEIGQISEIVESQFGWHIIQLLGREVRPLDQARYDNMRSQKFQSWLDGQREAAEIEIFDRWQDRVPTQPALQSF